MVDGTQRVALIGAADLGVTVAAHIASIPDYDVAGFFDDTKPVGTTVSGLPVLGGLGDVVAAHQAGVFASVLITIGYHHLGFRAELYDHLTAAAVPLATLIHPSAHVEPTASVEEGSILFPGCVVDAGSVIRANSLLNTSCTIAHDTTVGPHTFLGPAVTVAGYSHIGAEVFLGVGTVVIDNVTVHNGARSGAGAVVVRDVAAGMLVAGVPAKPLNEELE